MTIDDNHEPGMEKDLKQSSVKIKVQHCTYYDNYNSLHRAMYILVFLLNNIRWFALNYQRDYW